MTTGSRESKWGLVLLSAVAGAVVAAFISLGGVPERAMLGRASAALAWSGDDDHRSLVAIWARFPERTATSPTSSGVTYARRRSASGSRRCGSLPVWPRSARRASPEMRARTASALAKRPAYRPGQRGRSIQASTAE